MTLYFPLSSIMAAASISHSGLAAPSLEDYSLYSNLSDDELIQLAIERSLNETHCSHPTSTSNLTSNPSPVSNPPSAASTHSANSSQNAHQPRSFHNPPNSSPAAQTTAHYSSPNPPAERPPDPYVSSLEISNSGFLPQYYVLI